MTTLGEKLAREEGIIDARRVVLEIISEEGFDGTYMRRIVKAMREVQDPCLVLTIEARERVDWMTLSQRLAQQKYRKDHGISCIGFEYLTAAAVMTPAGPLRCETYRQEWKGPLITRVAWFSEFFLDEVYATRADLKRAGLADRPHSKKFHTKKRIKRIPKDAAS